MDGGGGGGVPFDGEVIIVGGEGGCSTRFFNASIFMNSCICVPVLVSFEGSYGISRGLKGF